VNAFRNKFPKQYAVTRRLAQAAVAMMTHTPAAPERDGEIRENPAS